MNAKILDIKLTVPSPTDSEARQGYADAVFQLRPAIEAAPVAVITVRTYFSNTDQSLTEIITDARRSAVQACKTLAELAPTDYQGVSLPE